MLDVETIRKQFRKSTDMATDNKVKLKATYSQENPGDGPHAAGDLLKVYLFRLPPPENPDADEWEEVGRIIFTFDEGEPKSKTLEIDLTDKLNPQPPNFLRLTTLIDKNAVFEDDTLSEVEFVLKVKGKKRINNKYKTDLPLRIVDDRWALSRLLG